MPDGPREPELLPASAPSGVRPRGILAGLRIRKKLIVLHTSFSLSLAILLLLALRPALSKVITQGEQAQAALAIAAIRQADAVFPPARVDHPPDGRLVFQVAPPEQLGLTAAQVSVLRGPGQRLNLAGTREGAGVAEMLPNDSAVLARARNSAARSAVNLVYALLIVSLLAGYAFVAVALEVMVLPRHVYGPIGAMLDADDAVRRGDPHSEMVPESLIPADELGEIMRSRNESITALRASERQLASALTRLEDSAADLRKKNHLLETARRNLEGADRLASLGMMSAGIAHELNTPLAVVKGLVDKLAEGQDLSAPERALLARVVRRLEKLSEGLLDFARVRPPRLETAALRAVVEDAWTLIRLDRTLVSPTAAAEFINRVPESLTLRCDADRLVQVFVNLVRNAMGVMRDAGVNPARVVVTAQAMVREGEDWVAVSVADAGPGIPPEVIERLFEPFYSTRLDAEGTGLGLAVSQGIVREHGGVLIARNATDQDLARDPGITGAVFEILLPKDPAGLFGPTDDA